MASSKPRSSCSSFLHRLLSFLSLLLLLLSTASLAPTLLLRLPPSAFGWALATISALSLSSSTIGLCPHLARSCHGTHVTLVIASLSSQLLGILALFAREESSLSMLKSRRDPREAKALARLECGVLMAMFAVQLGVLILCCAAHRGLVREYEGLEAEREAAERRRRQRRAEREKGAAEIEEVKRTREFDEKMMRSKTIWAVDEEEA